MKNTVIFCSFDGTITTNNITDQLLQTFASTDDWRRVKEDLLLRKTTSKQSVVKTFSLLPSSIREDIVQYVLETAVIRDGFEEFVQFTKALNIPLYVVSNNVDFIVKPLLENIVPFSHTYCNTASFLSEYVQIDFPHECDSYCDSSCGCCKTSIMQKNLTPNQQSIIIGSSFADLEAAQHANIVIARDSLVESCKEYGISFAPFQSFYDCIRQVETRINVNV